MPYRFFYAIHSKPFFVFKLNERSRIAEKKQSIERSAPVTAPPQDTTNNSNRKWPSPFRRFPSFARHINASLALAQPVAQSFRARYNTLRPFRRTENGRLRSTNGKSAYTYVNRAPEYCCIGRHRNLTENEAQTSNEIHMHMPWIEGGRRHPAPASQR